MGLFIGAVAKKAGVSVDTVRYYEKIGLLPAAPRRHSGYRDYPEETAHRLAFIKNAREIGFTLSEIGELLSLRDASENPCGKVRILTGEKIAAVRDKIRKLLMMEASLSALVSACDSPELPECPLLDILGKAAPGNESVRGG